MLNSFEASCFVNMAEPISSKESSKGEDSDEAALSGDPFTAASKKNVGYFSEWGYLKTLSRQERRRIEGEIIKARKPGEINLCTYH